VFKANQLLSFSIDKNKILGNLIPFQFYCMVWLMGNFFIYYQFWLHTLCRQTSNWTQSSWHLVIIIFRYIQENYSKIRDVERELANLSLEMKLTAGPKKAGFLQIIVGLPGIHLERLLFPGYYSEMTMLYFFIHDAYIKHLNIWERKLRRQQKESVWPS